MAAVAALAAWEYASLCGLKGIIKYLLPVGVIISIGPGGPGAASPFAGAALVLMLSAGLFGIDDVQERFRSLGEAAMGLTYISLGFSSLVLLRDLEKGPSWVIVFLFILWVGDTSAFYGGSNFGRRKMAPLLSPKKTWEGAAFGLLGSVTAAVITSAIFIGDLPLGKMAVVGAVVGASGQLGDLLESLWKRAKGIKDSGKIIPGHGGILDRIDSLLLGVPVGYLIVKGWG